MAYHVPEGEFERIVAVALERIPAPLRARMDADNLMIVVQPESGEDDRDSGIDEHVLGFYQGHTGSFFSPFEYPKRIVLLQQHLERWSNSYAQLVTEVTDTVLHEVAHYFGMSHDDMRHTRLR